MGSFEGASAVPTPSALLAGDALSVLLPGEIFSGMLAGLVASVAQGWEILLLPHGRELVLQELWAWQVQD